MWRNPLPWGKPSPGPSLLRPGTKDILTKRAGDVPGRVGLGPGKGFFTSLRSVVVTGEGEKPQPRQLTRIRVQNGC